MAAHLDFNGEVVDGNCVVVLLQFVPDVQDLVLFQRDHQSKQKDGVEKHISDTYDIVGFQLLGVFRTMILQVKVLEIDHALVRRLRQVHMTVNIKLT